MTLPRLEVAPGLRTEMEQFERLLRSLSAEEWQAATRCAGWTVGDVAAHVVGTMADVTAGRFDGLGTPEVTEREVAERRGRTPDEMADELGQVAKVSADVLGSLDDAAWAGPAPTDIVPTLGEGVEGLWYDTYVHAEDIRAATGRSQQRGPGLRAAVFHLADLLTAAGWGPATLTLDGLEDVPVSGGGGRKVTGDPLDFVLAATGRTDPTGLGLDETVNVYR